jgi:hypothetical protein
MKKSIVGIVLVLVALGFGESRQVRDRGFVESIAVSSDANHVYTSVMLYDDTNTYKGIGNTVSEALKSAELRQGREYFTGHTELLVFYNFSEEVLAQLVQCDAVSPNCAVVLATTEVTDTQVVYQTLQNYQRLGNLEVPSASTVLRKLSIGTPLTLPCIHSDGTFSAVSVN